METAVLVCCNQELCLRVVHGAPNDRKASDGKRDVALSKAAVALASVVGEGSQALRKARQSSLQYNGSLSNSLRAFGKPGERCELQKLQPSAAADDFVLLQRMGTHGGSMVEAADDGHTASLPWTMQTVLKLSGDDSIAEGDRFYLNVVVFSHPPSTRV